MNYEIFLSNIDKKSTDFTKMVQSIKELVDDINSSLSDLKNTEISSLYQSINSMSERLKTGYQNCELWLSEYLSELKTLEDSLASFSCSGIEAPKDFNGEFVDLFGKVVMPILKTGGDKKANMELSKTVSTNIDMEHYPTGDSREDGISRAVLVAKYLMSAGGLSAEQAAALAGVYIDENNCDPGEVMQEEKDGNGAAGTGGNNYGAGIASWTFDKETSLAAAGFDVNTPIESLTMQQQCDMIIAEMDTQTYKQYYDALKRCDTLEDASATAVVMIGAPGMSSNWDTHPTPAEAKNVSDYYGRNNDVTFGPSEYHWNLDVRRLDYAQTVYNQLKGE